MGTQQQKHSIWLLALGALGVVYGDIGTSPLYALRECFHKEFGISVTPENILGILSLIFWTLVVTICVKYMVFVMRADNKGEGGILSLMALATGGGVELNRHRKILITFGLFGAALLFGESVITPAISVLSAVEGLKVLTPVFEPYIIPITVVVISILFLFQRFGTGKIGVVFGPIIMLWFLVLASMGIKGILDNPEVLVALNPVYAFSFFFDNGQLSLFVLGAVVLVITGGEALYADMGHFGKTPIRWAWFVLVFPALVLNYFGQGALLLKDPSAISNPFYLLAPKWGLGALVALSTAATVIASQALISGIFSIARQAVQMGFSPRMSIIHTSSREIGQIYIPFVNWIMLIGVLWLVLTFKTSSSLAAAYGIAVTGTMMITSLLAYQVSRLIWKWSWYKAFIIFGIFALIDFAFFSANVIKVEHGGWVPLVLAAVFYLLMSTWRKGRRILSESLKARSVSFEEFILKLKDNPPQRVPGSAIYMTSDLWGVPVPLLHNLKHNKVLHSQIGILSIRTKETPTVPKKERIEIQALAPQFYRIIAHYGFMETPKIKHILEACRERGIQFTIQDTTFVLGRETILATGNPNLSVWREKIFALMSRNAERPTTFFRIPPNQVIEVGIQVEI